MCNCIRAIRLFWLLFTFIFPNRGLSQAIDNTVSFRNINSGKYFRVFYENDFFSGTDRDYTQGIYIEKVNPWFKKFPFARVLWHPRGDEIKYGLAVEHDAYTPNFIDRSNVQYGDRPFAAALFLKTFLISTMPQKGERISTILSSGIIGPGAGGEQMQKTIHHWINYTQPRGWHNQISNDVVLNYQVNFEKEFFAKGQWLSLSSYNGARLGTLSDKMSAGFEIIAGHFNSPYIRASTPKKIQWYVYEQPVLNLVGYDATLQGGLFNHSSPYTIAASQVEHLVFQHRFGLVFLLKRLYLEYYQTGNTIEFKTSVYHRTGGLQVGFGFR
ncbi:MAG TPA: lipid A deacylase LpxR family protein [Puia sp.]|nr:lipid A deacylase LpxR family protein [Puia sp.]